MPTYPPLPAPVAQTLEEAMDALAYLLATDARTSYIRWVRGDVGTGDPTDALDGGLPFGYITPQTQRVKWYTANGNGQGGLAAGLDDWEIPCLLTVAFRNYQFEPPKDATPPGTNSIGALIAQVGVLPYLEQPGYRDTEEGDAAILDVLRTNITVGGYLATTNVTDQRHFLLLLNNNQYRATRIGVTAQQRRKRGT